MYSIAIGNSSSAVDTGVAVGSNAGTGMYSVAVGIDTTAGDNCTAVGNQAKAPANSSTAIGAGAWSKQKASIAIGQGAVNDYEYSILMKIGIYSNEIFKIYIYSPKSKLSTNTSGEAGIGFVSCDGTSGCKKLSELLTDPFVLP